MDIGDVFTIVEIYGLYTNDVTPSSLRSSASHRAVGDAHDRRPTFLPSGKKDGTHIMSYEVIQNKIERSAHFISNNS